MTTLLRVINSSKITILKISFSSNLVISIFLLVNISNLSTYFNGFASILQLYLTGVRGTKNANWDIILMQLGLSDNKNIKNIDKNAYIKFVDTIRTYIRSSYINKYTRTRDIFIARSICVKNTFVGGICTKSTYRRSASDIDYSGIYSNFF